jgi:2-dehydro-3-deoxygluconokinase
VCVHEFEDICQKESELLVKYCSQVYNVSHIIERIGAGDAFMAGIIYGLITWPDNHQTALEFAVAATCLKHSISGDINLATVSEIQALMSGSGGGRVSR